jgi:ABC-type lipoprotein release transport system permease subunit
VTSADELRAMIGEPSEIAIKKQVATIDVHCREFIGRSPFVLLATSVLAADLPARRAARVDPARALRSE